MLAARNLSIGERVYVDTEDFEQAVGTIQSIGDKTSGEVHFAGDELNVNVAVKTESGEVKNYNNQDIYKIVKGKLFQGKEICYEHHTDIDYPYYCPAYDENVFNIETEAVMGLRQHIIETRCGKVMLKEYEDTNHNNIVLDAYVGDNYDDYIGTINGSLDDDDTALEEALIQEGIV